MDMEIPLRLDFLLSLKDVSALQSVSFDVYRDHLERRAAVLRDALFELQRGGAGDYQEKILSISEKELESFLRSPGLMFSLSRFHLDKGRELRAFIDSSLSAMTCRTRKKSPDQQCWAPCGEYGWVAGRWREAPIFGGLVIDYMSPEVLRPLQQSAFREARIGQGECFSGEGLANALSNVSAALAKLNEIDPHIMSFIANSLNVVLLRKDSAFPGKFTSSSSRAFIGRALLLNIDALPCNMAKLCGAILHEAVHNFLYRVEWWFPLLPKNSGRSGGVLVSPWSGGKLWPQTYIHACFVYFCLFNFYKKYKKHFSCFHDEIEMDVKIIKEGFSSRDHADNMRKLQAVTDHETYRQMDLLCCEEVR